MAAIVTQAYSVPRNFQRATVQLNQVDSLLYDSGELAFLGLTQTASSTVLVGTVVERTLEWTDLLGQFAEMFPTQALMEAAVASLFQLVFELKLATGAPVGVQTLVVP